MAVGRQNRPVKFGTADRNELMVQESEVALRTINDTNGNTIFMGRAIVGTQPADEKWQIRKITYDSNESVLSVLWPIKSPGNQSSDYEFTWSANDNLDVVTISQANPAVVEVLDVENLQNGDKVILQNVAGMTEVNFDGTNIYTVANLSGMTFELQGINSTGYGAYSSGGEVFYGAVLTYTFS